MLDLRGTKACKHANYGQRRDRSLQRHNWRPENCGAGFSLGKADEDADHTPSRTRRLHRAAAVSHEPCHQVGQDSRSHDPFKLESTSRLGLGILVANGATNFACDGACILLPGNRLEHALRGF